MCEKIELNKLNLIVVLKIKLKLAFCCYRVEYFRNLFTLVIVNFL